ncbi:MULTISPECIES: nicotinate phosphoribosyltransferase [Aerococcus]|uniref:Nicotinate phosphoribosyltransferase n=1 Tax=Aerococcus urinae TaxID=1376 RepID=A0A2I1L5C2_9LACT|nr:MULTISPECIES: nicotinate phosphoribosyltransferase [Aerococcus]KAA9219582.1 nicotinate phosphoribosyltransferase [Aerococcus loyolae]KAA9266601.1 nicotinate phosphoribosyltransferase [Aerococcus loyolae]MCY3067712.1 nicotinate phosphoribosyltransferase [Aerococcus mictus]MCY3080387.1 nicotinate phosphoribosyltransferase [Aerococcus mictus]MDK6231429.1 nicotinate phosphoribosyltransferase [Aerococcus urinae]
MTTYPDDSLALHTDLYEINMMKTYWEAGNADQRCVFEMYFRNNPFENGYAIFAGLEHLTQYLDNLTFSESDIAYLRETQNYPEEFLEYLANFRFNGTIRSMVEGEVCFANEPLLQVEGSLADCQLIETALLNIINFQTLIATKASRIRTVCGNDALAEFGARRAHELDASIWGGRAAYIGGFDSTSNVRAGKILGVPVSGTHAHAMVQAYRSDYEAFKHYAESHKNCVFLVDTYDVLNSGVPNAIRVAREMGDKINFVGVRIDSGDITYLSKRVRKMLDEAGYPDAIIVASNDLDEKTILNLKMQGAKVDSWGVGTKLITAYDQASLGGVYKLCAIEDEKGDLVPTMKLSSSPEKVTTPGKKQIWRITNNLDGKSEGDYVTVEDEVLDTSQPLYMFHPTYTYINKTVEDFSARPLLQTIYQDGKRVYDLPALEEVKSYAEESLAALWDEYKRILNPEAYPVDLSQELYDLKMDSIHAIHERVKAGAKKNPVNES